MQHTMQVLQLLGKLGARNRRWLRDPRDVPYRNNSEHGMRVILTFHPSTSFLVPMDRCISLVRGQVAKGDAGEPSLASTQSQKCFITAMPTSWYSVSLTFFAGWLESSILSLSSGPAHAVQAS